MGTGGKFYFSFLTISAITLLGYNAYIVTLPYPIGLESVPILQTRLFLGGTNPYAPEMMPTYAHPYGVLYSLIIFPFASVFGSTLELHRALSALTTIGFLIVLFFTLRKVGATLNLSLSLTLLWWAQVLVLFNPVARVDSMGSLFYILALSIPYLKNFSKSSLYIAALFAVGAFFIKQYFFLSALIISFISFFYVSPFFGIFITFIMVSIVTILLTAFAFFFPTYIENFLIAGSNYYVFDLFHLLSQLWHLLIENVFLSLAVIIFLVLNFSTAIQSIRQSFFKRLLFHSNGKTEITKSNIHFWQFKIASQFLKHYHLTAFCLILPFVLIAQGLANSYQGGYMTQLVSPLCLIVLARYLRNLIPSLLQFCACINLLWAISAFHLLEQSGDRKLWKKWEKLIATKTNISAPSNLSILLDDLNKPVYDAGLISTFEWSTVNASINNAWKIKLLKDYKSRQNKMVLEKKFDLIIRPANLKYPNVEKNYHLLETLRLPRPSIFGTRSSFLENNSSDFKIFVPK